MSDSCDPEEGLPEPSESSSQNFDEFCNAMFSQVAAVTGVRVADLLSPIDPNAESAGAALRTRSLIDSEKEREGASQAIRAGLASVKSACGRWIFRSRRGL